jgi:hypothetical protein
VKKFAAAALLAVFGASAALAATNPAVAGAVAACCDSVCCALGLPCC